MTLENCKKYLAEATDENTKKFWEDRIKRKYPKKIIINKTPITKKVAKK